MEDVPLAGFLGFPECSLGVAQQRFGVGAIIREQGNSRLRRNPDIGIA